MPNPVKDHFDRHVWQGRRIARHVWQGGTQGSPTFKSSHRWLYDGWNVVAQFTAPSATSTTLTRTHTFTWGLDLSGTLQGAGGVGGLLVQTTITGGAIERASYDGNGNIVSWTNSTANAPTSRREYDAFGNTLVSEGSAPSNFGFSTKMQDVETGLYYYGYRFYDPVTGRWPSRDPIGEKGGVNLYGFVSNSSIMNIDRLGQDILINAQMDELDTIKNDDGKVELVEFQLFIIIADNKRTKITGVKQKGSPDTQIHSGPRYFDPTQMDKIPGELFVEAKGRHKTVYQSTLQVNSGATYEVAGTEDGCEFLATIELTEERAKLIHLTWCKHKPQVVSNESIHARQSRRPGPVATQLPVDGNAEKDEEICNDN